MALHTFRGTEEQQAPFFCSSVSAFFIPRANRSIGALANTRVNSNSAIARPNISNVTGPPFRTDGKLLANLRGIPARR